MMRPALFLDRDGTLVQPVHYPRRPEDLHLYEAIAPGLRLLQALGYVLVVVTNQSGLARGYFTEAALEEMHAYLRRELAREGVYLAAIYYCPHHPEGRIPALAIQCNCRKPQPGLLLRAAAELRLDLTRSWFVGDILDDVEAGNRAGCRTVLVDLGTEGPPESALRRPTFVARDTCQALELIVGSVLMANASREPDPSSKVLPCQGGAAPAVPVELPRLPARLAEKLS
ncbi:D-glycero-alpha-D-manno-heptose-1,7-bisphosphate 7-phosphatase [Thermogemmatispora onikobensis]|uniref:D-glycero-alpha-D-manno-heptose-1,7-bisphosphate 7-phosphatase n=1 Tax=Thermogemmatispora onikobensis TaxID=732234 RepID=UPI000853A4F1|nr:HAD family hydrolase [Thermogemmatispora onikobensis]